MSGKTMGDILREALAGFLQVQRIIIATSHLQYSLPWFQSGCFQQLVRVSENRGKWIVRHERYHPPSKIRRMTV